jgi:hypothetical protein
VIFLTARSTASVEVKKALTSGGSDPARLGRKMKGFKMREVCWFPNS